MRTTKNPIQRRTTRGLQLRWFSKVRVKRPWLLSLVVMIVTMFPACGSGPSSNQPQIPFTLTGNWQFTMAPPSDGSFTGGLQGGFLLQSDNSATGSIAYSVALPTNPSPTVCNSGSATVSGTITPSGGDQAIVLTVVAGTQTFTLTGTLSFNGLTMGGTYNSTSGTAADGTACGTVQTGLQWSAAFVPPLTGSIQGSFLSTGGTAGLTQQEYLVSGSLNQAANDGASATVTGTLNFLNAITDLSDYPCFAVANVSGQISGNSVSLQILGADGSNIGQIGSAPGAIFQTVTYNSVQNGYALQSLAGTGYAVYASGCGGGSLVSPADSGNICLGVNSTSVCQQPITLSPSALIFSPQSINSPPTMQTITLTNTYGSALGGIILTLTNNAVNFTETDNCGPNGIPSQGQPISLSAKQSCVITISFSPQQSCAAGTLADQCLITTLTVTSPNNEAIFTVPITGGVNDSSASAREFDFGAEGISKTVFQFPQILKESSATPLVISQRAGAFQDAERYAEID